MSNVDKAVEALDKLAQDEAGRKALGEIAERLARLFGGTLVSVPKTVTPSEPVVPEQTEFDVLLGDAGAKKIDVIKAIREITGLGLKESKDFVEGGAYPKTVKETVSKEEALKLKTRLEAAGATVVIK